MHIHSVLQKKEEKRESWTGEIGSCLTEVESKGDTSPEVDLEFTVGRTTIRAVFILFFIFFFFFSLQFISKNNRQSFDKQSKSDVEQIKITLQTAFAMDSSMANKQ